MKKTFCLQVFIKRLHSLIPRVTKDCEDGIQIIFLDFPEITIKPQHIDPFNSMKVGISFTFNTCHIAEFLYDDDKLMRSFPTRCNCKFKGNDNIRWKCMCQMIQKEIPAAYATCPIKDQITGKTVGYVEMTCRVFAKDVPKERSLNPTDHELVTPVKVQSKPYIVRVIVNRVGEKKTALDLVEKESPSHTKNPSHSHQSDVDCVAKVNTLLCTLRYNVAYQLQSISEFISRALKHDHECLNKVQLSRNSKDLESDITKSVEYIVKLCNIVLQISNQLAENGNALETTEHFPVEIETALRRNPVNKLPVPTKGSVAHFAMYEVLFQLQYVGANLSYVTLAYHKALEIPLDTLSKQDQTFCHELDHTIQILNKQLNILIQSTVDGRLESTTFALPAVGKKNSNAGSSSNIYSSSDFSKSSSRRYSSFDKSSLRSTSKSEESSSTSLSMQTTVTQRVSSTPVQTQKTSIAAEVFTSSAALKAAELQVCQLSDSLVPNALPLSIPNTPSVMQTSISQTRPSEPVNIPTLLPSPFTIATVVESLVQKTATTASFLDVVPVSPFSPTQFEQGLPRQNPSMTSIPVSVPIPHPGGFPLSAGARWPSAATLPSRSTDSSHSDSVSTSID
ncbi:unnamed protein product [Phytomonas sp. Hart1]|nr:unnamed protein product [Phytomonas sp. Hart1]|eukprot:CCW68870.1 unnamed protein product [Phytomonas sp. isolate Hart1]